MNEELTEGERQRAEHDAQRKAKAADMEFRRLRLQTAAIVAGGVAEKNSTNEQIVIQSITIADELIRIIMGGEDIRAEILGHGAVVGEVPDGKRTVLRGGETVRNG